MAKSNRGFAMVVALVVIVVLFSLSAALTVLINGEISLSSNNFERIQAKYNAEAGIEKGIAKFKNNQYTLNNTAFSYDQNSDNWTSDDDYYEYKISKPDDYKIESTGYYRNKEKTIVVQFEGGNFQQSFIYGNEFTINRDEDLNNDVGAVDDSSHLAKNVDLLTYFDKEPSFAQLNSKDLYRNFIKEFYDFNDDVVGSPGDTNDYDYPTTDPTSPGEVTSYEGDITYTVTNQNEVLNPSGEEIVFVGDSSSDDYQGVYHYRGNLTFEGNQNSELLDENNLVVKKISDYEYLNPPVIVVDGTLEFNTLNAVRNFIFIVKGDIIFKTSNAAKTTIDKTFFYTEEDFNYFLDANNISNQTDTPHMFLDGQIIAENNINIKIKEKSDSANNNDANYSGVNWPSFFDYSDSTRLDDNNFQLINWDE